MEEDDRGGARKDDIESGERREAPRRGFRKFKLEQLMRTGKDEA